MNARLILDIFCALVGLVCVSPLLGVVGLFVKLADGGPVLYKAKRVGVDGKTFTLYKFRTMVVGADHCGSGITWKDDSRVTRLGRFLRKTKIDELPNCSMF